MKARTLVLVTVVAVGSFLMAGAANAQMHPVAQATAVRRTLSTVGIRPATRTMDTGTTGMDITAMAPTVMDTTATGTRTTGMCRTTATTTILIRTTPTRRITTRPRTTRTTTRPTTTPRIRTRGRVCRSASASASSTGCLEQRP